MSATLQLFETSDPITLKLFAGGEEGRAGVPILQEESPPDASSLTLRQAWELFFRVEMERSRARNTISGDLTALNHFERRTINPALNQITDELLADFQEALLSGEKWGPNRPRHAKSEWRHKPISRITVAKIWRSIRKILRRVGPRHGSPRGRGLIEFVPHMECGGAAKLARKRMVTADEVDRLYEAFSHAEWPVLPLVAPSVFWRAALSVWWVYGHRTQDVVATVGEEGDLESTPPVRAGLLWSSVCRDRQCPDAQTLCESPWGWIDFRPQKTVNTSGIELILPLHRLVSNHLERLRGNDSLRVFSAPRCQRAFYLEWHAAVRRAGIDWDLTPIRFRATCNTAWNRLGGNLGGWVVGHSPQGVNQIHYQNPTQQLVDALPNYPMPDCFLRELETHRQGRLFS